MWRSFIWKGIITLIQFCIYLGAYNWYAWIYPAHISTVDKVGLIFRAEPYLRARWLGITLILSYF